jgi:hypothetical protein
LAKRRRVEEAEYLKSNFGAFIRASWSIVDPAMPLIDNWHIDALAEHLQAVADEQTRAWAAQPTVEAGGVFLPVAVEHQAIQVVDEAAEFPNGKNDDDVDAMTQFLNWIRTNNDFSTWSRLGAGR